jgi:hypothetical protein
MSVEPMPRIRSFEQFNWIGDGYTFSGTWSNRVVGFELWD